MLMPKAVLPSSPRLVFACGDKYVSPSCDEAAWLPTQADQAGPGLLTHDEGGPEGAVWNGDAALWIGTPKGAKSASFGGPLTGGQAIGERRWYRLDSSTWRKRLRKAAGKPYQTIEFSVEGRPVGVFWFAEGE